MGRGAAHGETPDGSIQVEQRLTQLEGHRAQKGLLLC